MKSFLICRIIETLQRESDSFWDVHEDASVSTLFDQCTFLAVARQTTPSAPTEVG